VEGPNIVNLRLDRPGVRAALGDLEAEVMELIWARPPGTAVTVREVFEALYGRRRLAYTTVMSTMARLARKGLLVAEKAEPAYLYRAALSREEFVDHVVGAALERLLVNFAGATRRQLEKLTDPEVRARLAELLEQVEGRRARGEK
jgi:predicted transcriptional regulator